MLFPSLAFNIQRRASEKKVNENGNKSKMHLIQMLCIMLISTKLYFSVSKVNPAVLFPVSPFLTT